MGVEDGAGEVVGGVAGEEPLRDGGDLEEEHVPALAQLRRGAQHGAEEGGGVRAVDDGEAADEGGEAGGGLPGDGAAPVMADEVGLGMTMAEGVDQRGDVGGEGGEVVAGLGLVGQAVAAEVGGAGAEAAGGEAGEDLFEGGPALGEAVQKEDEGAVRRAAGGEVEAGAAGEDERLGDGVHGGHPAARRRLRQAPPGSIKPRQAASAFLRRSPSRLLICSAARCVPCTIGAA